MRQFNYPESLGALETTDDPVTRAEAFAGDLFKAARNGSGKFHRGAGPGAPGIHSWTASLSRVDSAQARWSASIPIASRVLSWQIVDAIRRVISSYVQRSIERITVEFVECREIDLNEEVDGGDQTSGAFAVFAIEPGTARVLLRLEPAFAISLIAAGLGLNEEQPNSVRELSRIECAIMEFLFLRITKEANREIGEPLLRVDRILSWIPREAAEVGNEFSFGNRSHTGCRPPFLAAGRWLRAAFRVGIDAAASFIHLYVSDEALEVLVDWHHSPAARKRRLRFAPSLDEKLARFKQITPDVTLALPIGHSEIRASALKELECGDAVLIEYPLVQWRAGSFIGPLRIQMGDGHSPLIFGELPPETDSADQNDEPRQDVRDLRLVISAFVRETTSLESEVTRMATEESVEETAPGGAEALDDLLVTVHVELAARRLSLDELARLRPGHIVELGCKATDPVDLLVDGRRLARGELVEMNGKLAVRITRVSN